MEEGRRRREEEDGGEETPLCVREASHWWRGAREARRDFHAERRERARERASEGVATGEARAPEGRRLGGVRTFAIPVGGDRRGGGGGSCCVCSFCVCIRSCDLLSVW